MIRSSASISQGADPARAGEQVVLAVTAPVALDLLPGLSAPTASGHRECSFQARPRWQGAALPGRRRRLAEWIFVKPGIVSTTSSAAESSIDLPADELARRLWSDVAAALALGSMPMPVARW